DQKSINEKDDKMENDMNALIQALTALTVITNQVPTTNNNDSTNTTMLLSQIQALATTLQAAQNSQTNTSGATTSLLATHEYMAGRKRTRLERGNNPQDDTDQIIKQDNKDYPMSRLQIFC
ncbi:8994_t:CDS:2, partial [Ambispora gerdemannii]